MTDWITTAQAGAELGITSRQVNYLIARGVLEAMKVTPRLTLVKRASLANYTPRHKRKDKPIE